MVDATDADTPTVPAAVVKKEDAGGEVKQEEPGEQAAAGGDPAGRAPAVEQQHAQQTPPPPKKGRRRDREPDGGGAELRWGLKRKIAALSREVELLSHEVARVRQQADASCSDPQLTPAELAIVAERHTRRMAEAQKRNISVLLRDIMSHKWAFPFATPVDTNMYRDYLTKVSRPMDFGTIRARLDAGQYAGGTDAFAADMRLVFSNAFAYNPPGSDVHAMAATLRDKFEERMKGVAARLAATEQERERETRELREAARRRLQESALLSLAPHRERLAGAFAAIEARCREAKSEAAQGCAFVTLEEKKALVDSLSELRPDEFEAAVQLALQRHPGMLAPGTEEFDLNLADLDSLTLRQLAAFCRACRRARGGPGGSARWPGVVFGAGAAGDKTLRKAAAGSGDDARGATAQRPAPAGTQAAAPPLGTPGQAGALPAAAALSTEPRTAQPLLAVRHVGERSWSVLDRDARLQALAAESPAAEPPSLPQQSQPQQPEEATATAPEPHPPLVVAEATLQGLAATTAPQEVRAGGSGPTEPQ